jgi:hypothetical protein
MFSIVAGSVNPASQRVKCISQRVETFLLLYNGT